GGAFTVLLDNPAPCDIPGVDPGRGGVRAARRLRGAVAPTRAAPAARLPAEGGEGAARLPSGPVKCGAGAAGCGVGADGRPARQPYTGVAGRRVRRPEHTCRWAGRSRARREGDGAGVPARSGRRVRAAHPSNHRFRAGPRTGTPDPAPTPPPPPRPSPNPPPRAPAPPRQPP